MPASSQSASNAPAQIAPRSDEKPSSKRQRDEDEPDENAKRIKTGEQFHCLWENCAETYDDIADLRSHVRNHAGQAMRCGWRNCDRAPEPAALIKKHIDSHVKPHPCSEPECTFRAAKTRDLTRHMTTHGLNTGTAVYFCPFSICPHRLNGTKPPFPRRDNAKRHIKLVHQSSQDEPVRGSLSQ